MIKYTSKIIKIIFALFLLLITSCSEFVVLDPKGPIGNDEKNLIFIAIGLMLIVVVPVYILAFIFSKKYRASKQSSSYQPAWGGSKRIEFLIWSVPILIVIILSYFVWTKTYELDPYKPLKSENKTIKIEVISLDWNWLFIYPDYNVAVINELVFPVNTPLSFKLTSASVMTSFFIPQLGSQMYAMAGMQTHLNLMANEPGVYIGHNQEFSGRGYNTMHFKAIAKTQEDFNEWIDNAKLTQDTLTLKVFDKIKKPNIHYPITIFSSVTPNLFDEILYPFIGWMGTDKLMMNKMGSNKIMMANDSLEMSKNNLIDRTN